MKILVSLAVAAACTLASPALAGPAGTGLTFTEEVAKKNFEKRSAKIQAAADCAASQARSDDKSAPKDAAAEACRAG